MCPPPPRPIGAAYDEPAGCVQPEDLQPVGASPGRRLPSVELHRHDQDVRADDVRVGDHPLLKILALPQSGLGEGNDVAGTAVDPWTVNSSSSGITRGYR